MQKHIMSMVAPIGRLIGVLSSPDNIAPRRALIIPPATPGSLGDAAMISASAVSLRGKGASGVDLLYGKEWDLDERIDGQIAGESLFYGGSLIQYVSLVAQLKHYNHVCLIGADVIDGKYNPPSVRGRLAILAEVAKQGKKATLLGASYNKNPEKTTRNALKNLPASVVICARDPVSKKRMEEALERDIRQVADLAFLLPARAYHPVAVRALSWIDSRHAAGDQVVAVNANYLQAEENPSMVDALAKLMEGLLAQPISVLLVPHDTRSARPDQVILAEAAAKVTTSDNAKRIHMVEPQSPGAIKAILAQTDLLVTGRMHAAILGMGAGTPAFSFAYQDKFEGLYSFFGLENADLLYAPESFVANPDEVLAKVLGHLKDTPSLKSQIKEKLPHVIQLAQDNFL